MRRVQDFLSLAEATVCVNYPASAKAYLRDAPGGGVMTTKASARHILLELALAPLCSGWRARQAHTVVTCSISAKNAPSSPDTVPRQGPGRQAQGRGALPRAPAGGVCGDVADAARPLQGSRDQVPASANQISYCTRTRGGQAGRRDAATGADPREECGAAGYRYPIAHRRTSLDLHRK